MISLSPYDPESPRIFEAEAEAVADALQPVVQVDHVGSTSVPGLAAKPTIDIAVAVRSLEVERSIRRWRTDWRTNRLTLQTSLFRGVFKTGEAWQPHAG